MNILKITVASFAVLALSGCSLLKVAVSTGEPLSREDVEVRTLTRGFYYDMAADVARTADSIIAAAPDIQTRVGAIRWKIRTTRAGVTAAMQGIPDVALADLWILCRRMNDDFMATPDSLLFGAQTPLARDAAARLNHKAERLAERVLDGNRFRLMSRFVTRFVADNPVSKDGNHAANTTLAWVEFLRESGIEHPYATGSIAEVLADVNDRMSGQTHQLSNSIGWSKDMIQLQLQQDSIRSQLGRQLDSLERTFNRIVTVAEHFPEISDHLINELSSQVTHVVYTMNAAVDNAFENLDNQRGELQKYISYERQMLVDQLRTAAEQTVNTALKALPGVIGKVIFYVTLSLLLLFGLPFAAGFWLGRLRERHRKKNL